MPTSERLLYSIADRNFYETFDRYQADDRHFLNVVRPLLPADWETGRGDIWYYCKPPNGSHPQQGWKIHVSGSNVHSKAILRTVVPVLVKKNTAFKFAADAFLLRMQASKQWPRGKAGKFITIYPESEAIFKELMFELDDLLQGYTGPFILSDKRFREGSILYYRYGSLSQVTSLTATGEHSPVIIAPDGSALGDARKPYSSTPDWAKDPFGNDDEAPGEPVLKNGRYSITSVLTYSNSGGVYKAIDNTNGSTVVIKEARPLTNLQPYGDAVSLLKKEHRLLMSVADAGIAPRPLDFFKEWEHWFLVEEFLESTPLRYHSSLRALALRTRFDQSDVESYFVWFRDMYTKIAKLFDVLHNHRIVFGDVSHYNVLVLPDDSVRLIDFEAAFEENVDDPTHLFTAGFASSETAGGNLSHRQDDYFGVGALMLAGLMPINAFMYLKPQAHVSFASSLVKDLGLPASVRCAIEGLMAHSREDRLTPKAALDLLWKDGVCSTPAVMDTRWPAADPSLAGRVADYLIHSASHERTDRLFPADPSVFSTNPLSLAYGASGIAYAIQRIKGSVPNSILEWMCSQETLIERYPPGFYIGLSGIAWAFWETGLKDKAITLMRMAADHPLLFDGPDLYYGAAGWGLACLRFFNESNDEWFLTQALRAAKYILHTQKNDDSGVFWESQRKVYYGLGHGASGIGLFLLYLYLVTGTEEFLNTGLRGLDFELAHGRYNLDGGLTWILHEGNPTSTPYMRYGSAGVGMVLARYWNVMRQAKHRKALDEIVIDTDRKYAIFPGRSFGLSGPGEFFLDLAEFTGNPDYYEKACKVAAGVALFAMEKPEGVAFPGEELMRITCDYATGSAGVGLFLKRLHSGGPASFFLDNLLKSDAETLKTQRKAPAFDQIPV